MRNWSARGVGEMGLQVRITLWISCFCLLILLFYGAFFYFQTRSVYLHVLDSALLTWGGHLAESLEDADDHARIGMARQPNEPHESLDLGFVRLERWGHSSAEAGIAGNANSSVAIALAHQLGISNHPPHFAHPTFFTEKIAGKRYRVLVFPATSRTKEVCLSYARLESLFVQGGEYVILRFAVMGGALFLIVSVGGYLFTGYLVRPIEALRDVSKRIAEGKLGEGIELTGSSELVSLSESINHMRRAISEKMAEAESRQREILGKSEELKSANQELERAIFQANQMAADAEIRSYEMEREVVQRRKAEEALRASEEKYRAIVENIRDGYCEVGSEGVITFANRAMAEITGYSMAEIVGKHRGELVAPERRDDVLDAFSRIMKEGGGVSELEYPIQRKGGRRLHVGVSVSVMLNRAGERVGFRTIVRDVEARKRYEEELIHMAYHDPLTGLNNRKGFYEKLEGAIIRATRYGSQVGLLYIDVDRFKKVNDALGHECGDEVLVEIARRLVVSLRQSDCVARLGGDEFAVILDADKELDVDPVIAKLEALLKAPYAVGNTFVDYISGSVGVALFPDDAVTAEDLVRYADSAMYKQKRNQRCQDQKRA